MTFSDLIDCLSRSAFDVDALEPLLAWPAEPEAAAGVSIVLASSLAPRILRSLKFVLPPGPPRFDCEAELSFSALEVAGGRGDTTLPLSDQAPWALC